MASSAEDRVKVLVVGPSKSGKTTVADFLAGARDTPTSTYYETSPLRILETEVSVSAAQLGEGRKAAVLATGEKQRRLAVRLWDVGGAAKHQAGWPAVREGADAILFVFNPAVKGSEKELGLWFKNFAVNQEELDEKGNFARRVPDDLCLILAHHSADPDAGDDDGSGPGAPSTVKALPMPKGMEKMTVLESSLDYRSDNFQEAFVKLVERVALRRMDADEEEVLRQQREAEGAAPKLRA